jgi:hypothetical protein
MTKSSMQLIKPLKSLDMPRKIFPCSTSSSCSLSPSQVTPNSNSSRLEEEHGTPTRHLLQRCVKGTTAVIQRQLQRADPDHVPLLARRDAAAAAQAGARARVVRGAVTAEEAGGAGVPGILLLPVGAADVPPHFRQSRRDRLLRRPQERAERK